MAGRMAAWMAAFAGWQVRNGHTVHWFGPTVPTASTSTWAGVKVAQPMSQCAFSNHGIRNSCGCLSSAIAVATPRPQTQYISMIKGNLSTKSTINFLCLRLTIFFIGLCKTCRRPKNAKLVDQQPTRFDYRTNIIVNMF